MITTQVPLSAYGGASGATLLWSRGTQLWLTSILKVQLQLVSDDMATLGPSPEVLRVDSPHDAGPARALEIPTDLSPSISGAEVLLTGHACAPAGQPVTSLSVRLFVGGDDVSLVDKTLHVYGDRPKGAAAPRSFQRMAVAYERAVGGPNTDNPVGRPLNDPTQPPNVVNPVDPWIVAGFGPIAAGWPMRKRLARTLPVLRGTVLEIPDDLPLEYFITAPKDQRAPHIAGDEWIIIDGMHAEHARFQSQLPGLRARARLTRTSESGTEQAPLELAIARVCIDMDRHTVELTWRGTAAIQFEELGRLQVVAGVDPPEVEGNEPLELGTETMMLNEDQLRSALGGRALPWQQSKASAEAPQARKSAPGKALQGLPFAAPPNAQGPLAIPFTSGPRGAAQSDDELVPSAPTPVFQPEFASEVTITNVDDSLHGALPFGKGARAAAAPTFGVPRLTDPDEDSDDSGGLTAITPVASGTPRSALPFMPARGGAPAPARPASALGVPFAKQAPARVERNTVNRTEDLSELAGGKYGPAAVGSPLPFSPPGSLPTTTTKLDTIPEPTAPGSGRGRCSSGTFANGSLAVGEITGPQPAVLLFGTTLEPPRAQAPEPEVLGRTTVDMPVIASETTADTLTRLEPEAAAAPVEAAAPPPQEAGIRKTVLDNVRAGTAMHGMDLSSADLSGLDLHGAMLSDARLTGAKLANVNLKNARLSGAKLMGADLTGADLTEADLSRADLTRATLTDAILDKADLCDANVTLAQVGGAKLRGARADRANFVQAHLERATLDGISLRDADLSGAFIAHASFREAIMTTARCSEARGENATFDAAQLDNAIFTGASFEDATFNGIIASRSNWERAILDRTLFDRATLREATFARASLEVASFLGAELTKADLSNVSADGADLSEAKLVGCDMRMSKLSDARLENASLRDANAQKLIANGARLEGADLQKASLRGARMKGCDLARTKLDGTDFRDADLEGAKFGGVDTSKAKLAGANLKGAQGLPPKG